MPACSPRPARTGLLLVAGLLAALALPGGLLADDSRSVVLPLAAGKSIEGVVESADEKEVVLRVGPEERRRIPWAQLTPLGIYRAKEALTPAADGPGRLALAELAAEFGLHAEARVEYEKAFALGTLTKDDFVALVAAAERAAVEHGVAVARRLADAGDLAGALEVARGLKLAFGEAPNAPAIRKLIEGLLEQVRAQDEAAKKELEDLAKLEAQARRQKEILERRVRADGSVGTGDQAAKRCADAREQGAVTRAAKTGEEAYAAYTAARKDYGRLRRILPPEDAKTRDEVAAKLNELDRKQFALCLALAKWFVAPGARAYDKAEHWAMRAAYLDPVNPELLELRQRIVDSRIRYRLSDVTNARPIVR